MKPTPIVLVGGGGHGSDVLGALEAINHVERRYEIVGYVAEAEPRHRRLDRRGVPYLGTPDDWPTIPSEVVVAIGDPMARSEVVRRLDSSVSWAGPIVHPSASVGAEVTMAPGVVVLAHVSVSADVRLGAHTHVSQQVAVGHDAVVGESTSVFPGGVVGGEVILGHRVLVGSSATILPGRSIGDGATLGAGAVVAADVPAGVRAMGVPARWSL